MRGIFSPQAGFENLNMQANHQDLWVDFAGCVIFFSAGLSRQSKMKLMSSLIVLGCGDHKA